MTWNNPFNWYFHAYPKIGIDSFSFPMGTETVVKSWYPKLKFWKKEEYEKMLKISLIAVPFEHRRVRGRLFKPQAFDKIVDSLMQEVIFKYWCPVVDKNGTWLNVTYEKIDLNCAKFGRDHRRIDVFVIDGGEEKLVGDIKTVLHHVVNFGVVYYKNRSICFKFDKDNNFCVYGGTRRAGMSFKIGDGLFDGNVGLEEILALHPRLEFSAIDEVPFWARYRRKCENILDCIKAAENIAKYFS